MAEFENLPRTLLSERLEDLERIRRPDVTSVLIRQVWNREFESVAEEIRGCMFKPEFVTVSHGDSTEIVMAEFDSQWDLKSPLAYAFYRKFADVLSAFQKIARTGDLGIRIDRVNSNHCSNFHVDFVPLRLIMTLSGPGTEWLANEDVDREALRDRRFDQIRKPEASIQRTETGDVLLMKGAGFMRSSGERDLARAFVHRSPPKDLFVKDRLVLRIDEIHEPPALTARRFFNISASENA